MCRSTICLFAAIAVGILGANWASAQEAAQEVIIAPQPAKAAGEALGFVMRPDGNVVGRVTLIDPGTFELLPVPNATVNFLQNRSIIAQPRTAADGTFTVGGLTPWATYSVVVNSAQGVAAFAVAIWPEAAALTKTDRTAPEAASKTATEVHLVSATNAENVSSKLQASPRRIIPIQLIPLADLIAILGLGGPGDFPPGFAGGFPIGGGGFGGGGGGGGGGGFFPPIPIPFGDDGGFGRPLASGFRP